MDKAQGAAALAIIANLHKQLGAPGLSAADHSRLLVPVYGITWNRNVIRTVTTNELNRLFVWLRNSLLPAREYERLTTFFYRSFSASNQFFPRCGNGS